MSSTQSRTLSINYNNCTTYITAGGDAKVHIEILGHENILALTYLESSTSGYGNLTDSAKNVLFPNVTAHPIKMSYSYTHNSVWCSSATTGISVDGTSIVSYSSTNDKILVAGDSEISAVLNSKKSSAIHLDLARGRKSLSYMGMSADGKTIDITLFFTRYDFSAVAGTGVTSASVSSSTGYDGDTITFTASLQSGYTFDGWYNGSTKVSSSQTYAHTVAGADMALTAKAIASTKTVTTKYGATTIATEQRMPPVAVSYGSTQIVSVASGQTKTLNCLNNLMSSNLTVGGKTLLCANQIMNGDIIVSVS